MGAGRKSPATLAFGTGAFAEYPETINRIIGFNAGGGTDLAGRALVTEMQYILGQPVVVVNQPGAASLIAAGNVARARPDGYTIWSGSAGTLATTEALGQAPASFDDGLKLAGISLALVAAIWAPPDSPFNSMDKIMAAANECPGYPCRIVGRADRFRHAERRRPSAAGRGSIQGLRGHRVVPR